MADGNNDLLPHIMELNRNVMDVKESQARLETEMKHTKIAVKSLSPRVTKLEHDQTRRNTVMHLLGLGIGLVSGFIGSFLQGKT